MKREAAVGTTRCFPKKLSQNMLPLSWNPPLSIMWLMDSHIGYSFFVFYSYEDIAPEIFYEEAPVYDRRYNSDSVRGVVCHYDMLRSCRQLPFLPLPLGEVAKIFDF
ncbi:MAG: hypothetical protein PUC06_08050 [Oscillospiraceae bacterium]|nr:hypothetical protein [Oscillospiraceae bacterium]